MNIDCSDDNVVSDKPTGSVKWFNPRSGYGFVCGDNEYTGVDILFIIHLLKCIRISISISTRICRICLIKSTNSNHEFHAINITGICRSIM
jgi:hypothetical protein